MTITLSSISNGGKMIVMLSDSAITNQYFDESKVLTNIEYTKSRKFSSFPGVGCVTTWGSRFGNHIETYLQSKNIASDTHSVEDLVEIVWNYLRMRFRPDEYENPDEVGYHVGGYDRGGNPRLFHLCWARRRPAQSPNEKVEYYKIDHSVPGFLYNGRNDLADNIVQTYIDQIQQGQPTRYSIKTLTGRIQFCDFVARFAAEMTPQVVV